MRPQPSSFVLPFLAVVCAGLVAATAFAQGPAQDGPAATPAPAKRLVADVLRVKCATCHQGSLATRPHDFRNASLEAIGGTPSLVDPGNPDDSPLFTVPMLRLKVHGELGSDGKPVVDFDDLAAIRTWIESLSETKPTTPCTGPVPPSRDAVQTAAAQAIEGLAKPARKNIRFISLAHLADVCAEPAALDGYRLAIALALNSVSRNGDMYLPKAVDRRRLIYKIDLEGLGWSAEDWTRLASGTPAVAAWDPATAAFVAEETGASHAVLMGEWLAVRVMEPEVYAQLLGLPALLPVMLSNLRIDAAGNIATGKALRRELATSTAGSARLIDRHSHARGGVWLASPRPSKDTARPPTDAATDGDEGLGALATHGIIPLANGWPAFVVAGEDGKIAKAADRTSPHLYPVAGSLACATCHTAGPVHPLNGTKTQTTDSQLGGAISADATAIQKRIEMLARALGIDAAPSTVGLAQIGQLAALASRRLDLARASGELGLTEQVFEQKLVKLGDSGVPLRVELQKGRLTRDDFERSLSVLTGSEGAASVALANQTKKDDVTSAQLTMRLDQARYQVGDLVSLTLHTTRSCHVTIINGGSGGRATVLLPNDFDQTSFLEAGRTLKLPGEMAAYQFRLTEPGVERLIALCSDQPPEADGLGHDFERLKFTELGSLDAFLRRVWTGEPVSAKPVIPEPPRAGRRTRSNDPTDRSTTALRPLAWTGVRVQIDP